MSKRPAPVVIKPAARLIGAVDVPGDKSISHRALIFGAIANGETVIRGLAPGDDVRSTKKCLRALGVAIEKDPEGVVRVRGGGFDSLRPSADGLDCGNSGTTIRLLAGVVAACDLEAELDGDSSLRRRPMKRVAEPLRRMGATITGDTAPLTVRGTDRPEALRHDLAISSAQVKSAILLAGLRAHGDTTVTEPVRSRDHTERMLRVFGVDVLEDGLSVTIRGPIELDAAEVTVPGDVSSAAFFACAAAGLPGSRVIVRDVGMNPFRTGVLDVLRGMGVDVRAVEERESGFEPVAELVVIAPAKLRPFSISGPLVPRTIDELVVLSVLATRADGVSEIRDAAELRVKESDRIAAIAENLTAMGAEVEVLPDGLRIRGPQALRGAHIKTHGDHRIAMAFGVAGLFATGETTIDDGACAAVSYPKFFETIEPIAQR